MQAIVAAQAAVPCPSEQSGAPYGVDASQVRNVQPVLLHTVINGQMFGYPPAIQRRPATAVCIAVQSSQIRRDSNPSCPVLCGHSDATRQAIGESG